MKEPVEADGAPRPAGPYSQAIRAGGFVFCAGQVGLDPATGRIAEGIEEQTRRVLENLRAVLEAAGLAMGDVVKTTVFLASIGDFGAMNRVYATYFPEAPPARTTVAVKDLPGGALVEIEAVAREG